MAIEDVIEKLDDAQVKIRFADGSEQSLRIVSTSHVRLDGTVWGIPSDPSDAGPGVQFGRRDVESVTDIKGQVLFTRVR